MCIRLHHKLVEMAHERMPRVMYFEILSIDDQLAVENDTRKYVWFVMHSLEEISWTSEFFE